MSATLYDQDFHAWTQEQARLLKTGEVSRLDFEHLLQEIESMGASERRELVNRLAILLAHLLKWRYQPTFRGRSWQLTMKEQRRRLYRHLRDNPSLNSRLPDFVDDAYGDAILLAANQTGLDESTFPETCPWRLDDILSQDYLPD